MGRPRRLLMLVLSAVVAAQATAILPVSAASVKRSPAPSGVQRLSSRLLPAPVTVDLRSIAKRGPRVASRAASWLGPHVRTGNVGRSVRAAAATSGPQAVEAATVIPGLSLGQNMDWYGQDQQVEPADAQVAASPSWLLEVAGNTMALFGRDGSVQWSVDLLALFQLTPGYSFYAPSLQYDYRSSRWFLGGIASNTSAHTSRLLLATSRTANPLGTWSLTITSKRENNPNQCQVACPNTVYFMRESIAVTDDKVVQANQAQNCQAVCIDVALGSIIVVRKAALLAGARPTVEEFSAGDWQTNFLVAQPQSLGDIGYLVWFKRSSATAPPDQLGLLQITGVPYPDPFYSYLGSTTVWEKDFDAAVPSSNVLAAEPGGWLVGSETPITSAVYRDGQVVLALNDLCGPTPDPRQVDCVRIIKLTNFGNATPIASSSGSTPRNPVPPPIATDLDIRLGVSQADLFDASLAIDPFGNLFVAAAFSSPDLYPGMAVTGIAAPIGPGSRVMPTSTIAAGPSSYNCGAGGNLWGSYMRSVPDPNNWSNVWMPGEAALDSCDWATVLASVVMGVGPRVTRMTPNFGSTAGGREVEIEGSYFVPGAQQVLFGSTPATILEESPWSIIVRAPAGIAGPVPVTVQTPDGTANAGSFTYITPGQRRQPAPAPSASFHPRATT